jgi:hypothetical protein
MFVPNVAALLFILWLLPVVCMVRHRVARPTTVKRSFGHHRAKVELSNLSVPDETPLSNNERIQKVLARAGVCSRRSAEQQVSCYE